MSDRPSRVSRLRPRRRAPLRAIPALAVASVSVPFPPPATGAPETSVAGRPHAPNPVSSPEIVARIGELVERYHELRLFNGAVLVARGDSVLLERGYGEANMEWGIPSAPDTRFRIGSITKQFTAALVLRLVEQGALRLDAPVSEYLPDYPRPAGDRITIHHLLTHTSGIPSYTGFPDFEESYARVLRARLLDRLGVRERLRALGVEVEAPALELSLALLERYVGRYLVELGPGLEIPVRRRGDALEARLPGGPWTRLVPRAEHRFVLADPPVGFDFRVGDDGVVRALTLRMPSGEEVSGEKVSGSGW